MFNLTNADLTTFAMDAVDTSCFQAKVILDRLKETGEFPRLEANSFYVKSCQHPADAVEDRYHKG
jgi:hypothetical protein